MNTRIYETRECLRTIHGIVMLAGIFLFAIISAETLRVILWLVRGT